MDAFIFLTVEDVEQVHDDQLALYGGSAGTRDRGLLESAVAAPQATFGGEMLHGDVFEIAAAYLFHLVKNHPFIDGNKRVGAACALLFLDLNGISIRNDEPAFSDLVLAVAEDKADKRVVAAFFRTHVEVP